MKVLISGATGLVGGALAASLSKDDHEIFSLTRSPQGDRDIGWNPGQGEIDVEKLAGFDAVVHLAGESIAEGRWTAAKKHRIRESRVLGTKLLSESLAGLDTRPRVFVSASAIGYYGDQGDKELGEDGPTGELFLSEVCRDWEAAAEPARQAGIRVVHPRIGVVLSKDGGALAKMLTPFKLGLGGRVGGGRQWMSWISLEDLVGVLRFLISEDSLSGPVNAVAPKPVTNLEFTKTLGRVLGRPTIFPMPALMARLALGEMADELLLPSTRVKPAKLKSAGYAFRHPQLDGALRAVLGMG
ncbi:MAG: TIGR01777 family oxidoreductase [Pirellulaceae bacterium]